MTGLPGRYSVNRELGMRTAGRTTSVLPLLPVLAPSYGFTWLFEPSFAILPLYSQEVVVQPAANNTHKKIIEPISRRRGLKSFTIVMKPPNAI